MKTFFKEYFNYSKRENRGIIVLVILIAIIYSIQPIFSIFSNDKSIDFSHFDAQISQFETKLNEDVTISKSVTISYFNFDPNAIDKTSLLKLGLSERQVKMVIKYREAGGVFYIKEDFKKIYAIDDELYQSLEPFIQIKKKEIFIADSKKNENYNEKITRNTCENYSIELNTADSIDLIKINGIGGILAKRIIDYKNILGGYYQKEQLLEVFGLRKEILNTFLQRIVVDTLQIKPLKINTADFKTLNKHPYLTYANTKSILKYRQLMGRIESVEVLFENHLVDSATYVRIKHYLSVD